MLYQIGRRLIRSTGGYPWINFRLLALRHRANNAADPFSHHLLCQEGTELVIEGYPRSGNSFALAAWQLAHQEDRPLAHHLHSPAQAIRASQLGVPALILIRDPLDAVASNVVRGPHLQIEEALRDYIAFYRTITRLPEQALVLATFQEITTDFGEVTRAINLKFSTSFQLFDHSEENVSRCFLDMKRWTALKDGASAVEAGSGAPSAQREGRLHQARAEIEAAEHRALLARARTARLLALQRFRPDVPVG